MGKIDDNDGLHDRNDPFASAVRIPRRSPTDVDEDRSAQHHSDHDSAHPDVSRRRRAKKTSKTSRTRVSYWDRPKPRRDWHWFLGRLGSSLIIAGLLVFLFVGYQLWGTGIEAAQSQQRLENAFSELSSDGGDLTPGRPDVPEPIVVAEGEPVAIIEIPAINLNKYVVAGVETADLKKGPGHYPKTPFPGELGNAAIAGHRTTYGEPFRQLDELEVGDPIIVTDLIGRRFTYLVTDSRIVAPKDSWVVATIDPTIATLTLTTCHPEFSAKQRLVVFAELDTTTSEVAAFPAVVYGNTTSSSADTEPSTTLGSEPSTSEPTTVDELDSVPGSGGSSALDTSEGDVFDKGWFSDPRATPHVIAWVLLDVLIVLGAWQIAKRLRNRAIGLILGVVPFFVVLYFVFQNVNRLLPPNL